MRIAYVAAGAGGMYCGSCIHDNTLATALQAAGHEVALIPTYTPLRTDEENVSIPTVFYGAINVYLQHRTSMFRHTPRLLDRLLDRPGLLRWVARFGATTEAKELGGLALDVLRGEHGPQAKELDRLTGWLRNGYDPDLVHITNSMLLGLVRRIREDLAVPVVVGMQGEDLFLNQLPEPYRSQALTEMSSRASEVAAFVAPSGYYADYMSSLLEIDRARVHIVPLGVRTDGHAGTPAAQRRPQGATIGYLARICPEKGLHQLVEAFLDLAQQPGRENVRLRVAGYLGEADRPYFEKLQRAVRDAGLADRFEYDGELDLAAKLEFFERIDIFSVPTTYHEPKGLFVLEALASGVPVVQPRHGSFPEMLDSTGGGLLVDADSPSALVAGLARLLDSPEDRLRCGGDGQRAVRERFNESRMARETLDLYTSLTETEA